MVVPKAILSDDKEMRPAHRVDVLTHALQYYAFTRKEKLGIKFHCNIFVSQVSKSCPCTQLHVYHSTAFSTVMGETQRTAGCCLIPTLNLFH